MNIVTIYRETGIKHAPLKGNSVCRWISWGWSAWIMTKHINYWSDVLHSRFTGEAAIQ